METSSNGASYKSSELQINVPDEENKGQSLVSPKLTPDVRDNLMTTPLKGILKNRDLEATPTRSDLQASAKKEYTRINTACNSRNRRKPDVSKPSFTQIIASERNYNIPKPVLTGKFAGNSSLCHYSNSPELDWYKSPMNDITISDDPVCIRANSALRRAGKISRSFEWEMTESENRSPWLRHRNMQLNSTEVTSSSDISSDNKLSSRGALVEAGQIDSGVGSMECINRTNQTKMEGDVTRSFPYSRSISPLLHLDQLSLHSRSNYDSSPWSGKKTFPPRVTMHSRKSAALNRFLIYRSFSWPSSAIPRSRVTPKYRSRHHLSVTSKKHSRKLDTSYDMMKSVYKDLLPSPLK